MVWKDTLVRHSHIWTIYSLSMPIAVKNRENKLRSLKQAMSHDHLVLLVTIGESVTQKN
jgi:hypothetical protein